MEMKLNRWAALLWTAWVVKRMENTSPLYYFYRLFPVCITGGLVIPVHNSVGLFSMKHKFKSFCINKGMLCCIVKLPAEVCVTHIKHIENKTVLQLKQFTEVLLIGLTLF